MAKKYIWLSLLAALALLSGLAATVTPAAGATALLTATPTVSATATATPAPAAATTVGTDPSFEAWCLPKGTVITHEDLEKSTKPDKAKSMTLAKDGTPELTTGDDACVFTFTFAQAAATDLKLEVYDRTGVRWLSSELKATDKPEMVFATLTHGYIVDPPFWSVSYTMKVVDASGAEKWSSPITFKRGYEPGKCYDGTWPDPVTWYCYYPPDAHPWDSWYKYENPRP